MVSNGHDQDYICQCIDDAEADQQNYSDAQVDQNTEQCPLASSELLVLIPRKPTNIFRADKYVKAILPDRYPSQYVPIKSIEYNFYPDLNTTRTVTAVVTYTAWEPQCQRRPTQVTGITVYFSLGSGTTADATLSAQQATSDSEGCASVDVTVNSLHRTKTNIEAAATIKIIASLQPQCGIFDPTLTLTIHRNEDVDQALAAAEAPSDFTSTLQPVLDLETWIVRQRRLWITSNGARAVQQLLNQVACRRRGGGHQFSRPDGQYGRSSATEASRFIRDFSSVTVAGTTAAQAFEQRQFAVKVEENAQNTQGVKTYVRAEYGNYAEGDVIDSHILIGLGRWQPGAGANLMEADGLLDIYTAVVWEFIETMHNRAREYADLNTAWYRHPNDNGGAHNWPAQVTEGVAYWYGGARSLSDFINDLTGNFATPPNQAQSWLQYLRQNNSRIGLHGAGDRINVPTATYNQYAHLNTDADIVNTAPAAAQPRYELRHPYIARIRRQYTGIDCSAYCQRVAMEAEFRAAHCADLAGTQICRLLPQISHNNGHAANRLTTRSWTAHYNRMPNQVWRREIAFRGDLLNVPGSHIVVLETDDRVRLTRRRARELQILHANGNTTVRAAAAPHWNPAQCIRRVVHSPMAQFRAAWNSWGQATANVHYGRIYLWR